MIIDGLAKWLKETFYEAIIIVPIPLNTGSAPPGGGAS
jgi:hypothetical protein